MQKQTFPDGGFVIHKITGLCSGKVSAWYDKDGKLIDAEQILPFSDCTRKVKGAKIINRLNAIGKAWK